jgi:hypothetical protein
VFSAKDKIRRRWMAQTNIDNWFQKVEPPKQGVPTHKRSSGRPRRKKYVKKARISVSKNNKGRPATDVKSNKPSKKKNWRPRGQ